METPPNINNNDKVTEEEATNKIPVGLKLFAIIFMKGVLLIISAIIFLAVPTVFLYINGYETASGLWVVGSTLFLIFAASVRHVMNDLPEEIPFWQKFRLSFLSGVNLSLFGILLFSAIALFFL